MTIYVVADLDSQKGLSVVRNTLEFAVRKFPTLESSPFSEIGDILRNPPKLGSPLSTTPIQARPTLQTHIIRFHPSSRISTLKPTMASRPPVSFVLLASILPFPIVRRNRVSMSRSC